MKYSDNELLQILKDFCSQHGRTPKMREISNYATIKDRFGSWNNAIVAAGLERLKAYDRSNDELLEPIREFYSKYKRAPKKRDIATYGSIVNHFGTWNKAIESANIIPNKKNEWTKDKIIFVISSYIDDNGRPPFKKELEEDDSLPDPSTFRKYMKTEYLSYIDNLGYNVRQSSRTEAGTEVLHSDEELIAMYHDLYRKLGRTPTVTDLDTRDDIYNSSIFYSRFSTMHELRKLADVPQLEITRDPVVTEEQAYNDIRHIYNLYGQVSLKQLNELLPYHTSTLLKRFKTTSIKDVWREIESENN